MAHYAFTNKDTGEVRFAESDLDPEFWDKSAKLSRKPTPYDDFVDDKLVKNKDREGSARKQSRARGMQREELLDMIEVLQVQVAALQAKVGI